MARTMDYLKRYLSLLILILIIALGVLLYYWYFYFFAYTRNAFVYANVNNVNSQVNGQIEQVFVTDNQQVQQGQLLVTLDAHPYQAVVNKAKAALQVEQYALSEQATIIKMNQAIVAEQQAHVDQLTDLLKRQQVLYLKKSLAAETIIESRAKLVIAQQSLLSAQEALRLAQQKLNHAAVDVARANL